MKVLVNFLILSLAMTVSCSSFAQQNAGPLNAAPGAPNQDPAQPSIATKTSTVVNMKNVKTTDTGVEACANMAKGAACEVAGINSAKLKGHCRPVAGKDSALTCKIR